MRLDTPLFFDTHCHLDFSAFACPKTAIEQARESGVEKILIPSIGESNWQTLQDLSHQYSSLYYALGLHPYFLDQHNPNSIEQLKLALQSKTDACVAIGECGLDFGLDENLLTAENIRKQTELFEQQIQLAIEFQLPLIIHSRKAHAQVLSLLKTYQPKKAGVIHAFSGSFEQAMEFIKLGFYIGVGGVITYPRANKTRQAIAQLPLARLVLETDAPDMPINGRQGQSNHPKYIGEIFDCLCELRKEKTDSLRSQLWHNSHKLFFLNTN